MPMCAGWRRYAGPVLVSSGSTPTNGASPMIWSAVPPPMTPAETVRPAFASFSRSILKRTGSDRTRATWLDRRLIHGETADLAPTGFGQQVREAMDQRREHHIEQRDATRNRDGRIFYRRNLLATLREREVARAVRRWPRAKALPFRAAKDGESVSGKFTGTVQLTSGKFAMVEKTHEFTLVPWRPIIDRQLGREVAGIMQGGSVSWQLGRQRGLEALECAHTALRSNKLIG